MPEKPIHPGRYVREHVLPPGRTVTAAAKLLGVGRPALSNFLNGKAALSQEMAGRLERAFGADRQYLLDLQARLDSWEESAQQQTAAVGTYAPTILTIKAHQIEIWANRIEARQQLPALLRRLIHSTGRNLALVDFPAYDNAERKGWDGLVETVEPTPWVPEGRSGWEFSCSQDLKSKADGDYAARIKSVPPEDRAGRTFVFVTPRNWPDKRQWAEAKKALGHWKDVRAYDASDLEQWIEQSAPVQIWFAKPTQDYRSLEQCWSRWASASEPKLPQALFDAAVRESKKKFEDWLQGKPDRPFVIAADSKDEALAFLASFAKSEQPKTYALEQRTIVCNTPEALRRLDTAAPASLVIAVHGRDVERELSGFYRRFHCIVVRPSNDVDSQPDITLNLLSYEDFEKALSAMNIAGDEVERLARESARSPTILRRRLPPICTPEWASDAETAKKLVPMALAGAWHEGSRGDREAIRLLANAGDSTVEDNTAELLRLDDPPVWSVGDYRGVVSRIDALFAIAGFITKSNLDNFFFAAEYMLSEEDPALDLPDDKQWMAEVYGKVRNHSKALRCGIRETLVLLAVYGNDRFSRRLGFDAQREVSELIQKLLDPLTAEKFFSHDDDLPDYAEAAPETFLRLIEQDLRESEPATLELMRPESDPIFGSRPGRTGLLWALERLAWNPGNLPRVADILARLSTRKIKDNWANKPEHSLQCIFRSWMPQTAAPVEDRIRVLETLVSRYPEIGWTLCIEQFNPGQQVGHYNQRPRWRSDASGAGQPVSQAERGAFVRKAIDLALNRPDHDEKTLWELVERLEALGEGYGEAVWKLIEGWADGDASDDAKADLRRRIQRIQHIQDDLSDSLACPPQVLAKLEPKDLVIRHAQLFLPDWIEWSSIIRERQLGALREIWRERGFDGVDALLDRSEPGIVGGLMAELLQEESARIDFVRSCLRAASDGSKTKYENCLKGFLWEEDPDSIAMFVRKSDGSCSQDDLIFLYLCLPFRAETWRRVDAEPEKIRNSYWGQSGTFGHYKKDCINEPIDRFLAVERPWAAFEVARRCWSKVETTRLMRLLDILPTVTSENRYVHDPLEYYISAAFEELDRRPGVASEEKARLEFPYLAVLERSERGIPNLEKQVVGSPALYVRMITLLFKRRDDGEDPSEWRIDDPERRRTMEKAAFYFLYQMRRIPGTGDHGAIRTDKLKNWLREVRALCKQYDRAAIGDQMIGQLLARAPADEDGAWPCRSICEVLEWMASKDVGIGFCMGTSNDRGVQLRGRGGRQERDLAASYRECKRRISFEFPYVGGVLEDIAAGYKQEADWWDTRMHLEQRLP